MEGGENSRTLAIKPTASVAFAVTFLCLAMIGSQKLLQDADAVWHIAVGQHMLETQSWITSDQWSFTYPGSPWIANQWLAECTMAWIHQWSGFEGILVAAVLLIVLALGMVYLPLVQHGLNPMLAALVLTIVFIGSAYNLHARPLLASLLFFGVTLQVLIGLERNQLSPGKCCFGLPLLFAIWANCHGAVLGGLATLWITTIGWFFFPWVGLDSPIRGARESGWMLLLLLLCSLSLMVNPYGYHMLTAWKTIMTMGLQDLIIEHAPLDPASLQGAVVLSLGGLYGVLLVAALWQRKLKVTWLLPLVWFALSLSRIRHASLFALSVGIVLPELLLASGMAEILRRRDFWRAAMDGSFWNAWWGWGAASALVFGITVLKVQVWGPGLYPPEKVYPRGILPSIREAGLADESRSLRVFNEYKYAGFIMLNCPRWRVVIDGRCELYGRDFLIQYQQAAADAEACRKFISAHPADVALVRHNSVFARVLRETKGWRHLQTHSGADLFVATGTFSQQGRQQP